jgi:hypothetical protein
MVRVLVTVEPRMYREAIALGLQRLRPDTEVMLVPEEVLDGQVDGFAPQVLVRNDSDGAIPKGLLGSVVCRVECSSRTAWPRVSAWATNPTG